MTREEAIKILKEIEYPVNGNNKKERDIAFDMAIKTLDVLDKIRAEIKEESRFCPLTEGLERALEIIDKYKAESEDNE